MTDLNDKHIAVLRKAAAAVKDRGHEGDARLADSVLGIVASVSARATPAPQAAPSGPQVEGGTAEQQARYAIDGAIQFGREHRNPPPSAEHWLYEYWNIGRQLATLGATGWDNVTPLEQAASPLTQAADQTSAAAPVAQGDVHDRIRAAGGIVHKDGNIFFKSAAEFLAAATPAAPLAQQSEPVGKTKHYASANGVVFVDVQWSKPPDDGVLLYVAPLPAQHTRAALATAMRRQQGDGADVRDLESLYTKLDDKWGEVLAIDAGELFALSQVIAAKQAGKSE